MQVQQLPGKVVGTCLQALRLPVSAAEMVLRRGRHDEAWEPALAFDSFGANVKKLVGSVMGDTQLAEQATLEQAEVTQSRRAALLEAEAEARKARADADLRERVKADEQLKEQASESAQRSQARLDEESERRQEHLDTAAEAKAQAAAKAESAAKKAVARQERAARATRLAAEQEALAEERRAIEAKGEVLDLDAELEASKRARKNGR